MRPSANVPPPANEQNTVRLPVLLFLYTLDQMASMLNVPLAEFKSKYCYFHLRNTGRKLSHQMMTRNIAPDDEPPEWRIAHEEFRRWLQLNGFKVYYGNSG